MCSFCGSLLPSVGSMFDVFCRNLYRKYGYLCRSSGICDRKRRLLLFMNDRLRGVEDKKQSIVWDKARTRRMAVQARVSWTWWSISLICVRKIAVWMKHSQKWALLYFLRLTFSIQRNYYFGDSIRRKYLKKCQKLLFQAILANGLSLLWKPLSITVRGKTCATHL